MTQPQLYPKSHSSIRILAALFFILLQPACLTDDKETPIDHDIPDPWMPIPIIPADNPLTIEKAELGRWFFYDRRLSANNTISCATCHRPELAFTDGRKNSPGINGDLHPLNTPGLTNTIFQPRLNWANPPTANPKFYGP